MTEENDKINTILKEIIKRIKEEAKECKYALEEYGMERSANIIKDEYL